MGGPNNTQLPVAQPIVIQSGDATTPIATSSSPLMASAIPITNSSSKVSSYTTTTTVYAPDGTIQKQQIVSPSITKTTMTTSPKATLMSSTPAIFRRVPILLRPCPFCQNTARTQTRTHPNWLTWIAVVSLLIIFWPIFWIPLVCDSWKQTDHYCSHCNVKVGEVSPFQDCCEKRRG
jgi:LITAF-like zinc ribbon domain